MAFFRTISNAHRDEAETSLSHEHAADIHARRRLVKRYGMEPTPDALETHLAIILAGESKKLHRQPDRKEIHRLACDGEIFVVVFNPAIRRIVTYLPKNWGRR